MNELKGIVDKTINYIKSNGCFLPESIIKMQINSIIACAKLEESMQSNQRFLDSIGTAFGNGANDRPNVIGDMITEPEQVGRWYQYIGDISPNFTPYNWYFCPTNNPYQESAFLDKHGEPNGFNPKNWECFDLTYPQLNNPDGETADYVNPITN